MNRKGLQHIAICAVPNKKVTKADNRETPHFVKSAAVGVSSSRSQCTTPWIQSFGDPKMLVSPTGLNATRSVQLS